MGYPPFFKDFLDVTQLDLKSYQMDLIVGGRACPKGVRGITCSPRFGIVASCYGASDLLINMAAETLLPAD